MSYNLSVYAGSAVSNEEAARIVASIEGLVPRVDSATGELLSAAYQTSGDYCFTIEGPLKIDESDILDERFDESTPKFLYQVLVEGSRAESVPHAVAFAQELARRTDGRMIDPQCEEAKPRRPTASAAPKMQLHLSWFRPNDGKSDLADGYLAAARKMFSTGAPTRFGTYEPLQGILSEQGTNDAEFGRMYKEKCSAKDFHFKGKGLRWGSITGWSRNFYLRYQELWVVLDLAALKRAGKIGAVEDFLVEVAERTGSFFAFAEVNATPLKTASSPHYLGAWSGLPSSPQWLTWYSSGYQDVVLPYLTEGVTTRHASGVSHRWTVEPSARDEIDLLLARGTWVPTDLLAPVDPDNNRKVLRPAVTVPPQINAS
ncbi:hypothetical protein V8Z69_10225 [Microbacterium aurugineum]|uniref:hypothetical protein n=1 Tax=Microbacterium aurugineum TaxID=2851642 RepID=UPI0039BEB59D